MYEVASLSQFCLRVAEPSPRQRKNGERELPLFVFQMSGRGEGVLITVLKGLWIRNAPWVPRVPETFLTRFPVSVKSLYIVTRVKCFSRGFGPRPKMCRPLAETENFRRGRENPLVPRVLQMHCAKRLWTTTVVNATDLQFLCHEAPIHYSLIRLLVPCLYVPSSLCQSASTRIARWLPPF